MSKRFKAAIIGGSGYGGGEMIRRLLLHPDVELVRVASVDFIGEPVSAAHPNLEGVTDLRFEELSPEKAAAGVDVVLLGMPHKVTAAKVPPLVKAGVKIVDMSGDFRLKDKVAYAKFYGGEHPCPELLEKFVYGLPELNRDKIKKATNVASPGCFATSIALALLPFAKANMLNGPLHLVGFTGSSGSGVAPSAGTHHPTRVGNISSYKPLTHQHTPEIEETLNSAGAKGYELRFVPVSAPLARGILITAFVEVPADTDEARIAEMFRKQYEGEHFVRIPKGRLPQVASVAGSNWCEVGFALGPALGGKTRTVACYSALDNLMKGGAGQAIQNMNIVLGLDEKLSLEDPGSWP